MAGEEFEISSESVAISPYHLLAASLASCTALTVISWASGAGIATERLWLTTEWGVAAGHPKLVSRIETVIHWPELPVERADIAARVAKLCPIHATLHAGAEATIRLEQS